jgi:hypothetical protein
MSEMMKCEAVRDALLEADMDELRGTGDSDVTRHVATCADCAAYARRIMQSYSQMAVGLGQMSTQNVAATVIPMKKRRPAMWLPLPLAAAAILALLLLRSEREELPNVDALAQLITREAPVASPPAGKQAMILERNDMTIVWLYQQEKL